MTPVLLLLGACTSAEPADQAQPVHAAAARPNVVVVMADDLDQELLDTLLARNLLPNIQRYLIDEGVAFDQSFVTNSLCCPSRATFLSGQYSHNHLVMKNYAPLGSVTWLDHDNTLATWLNPTYRTGHIGKFLNGYGAKPGFRPADGAPPGWDRWQGLIDPYTYNVYNYAIVDNWADDVTWYASAPHDYQTDVLADRAVRFIWESDLLADATPFFLSVNPIAPHVEIATMTPTGLDEYRDAWQWTIRPAPRHASVPAIDDLPVPPVTKASFNEADVTDKPGYVQSARPALEPDDIAAVEKQWRDRAKSMLAVDDMVGAIVASLRLTGELDRTVLVFTSDNGFLHGEHRISEKLVPYEESIRVPLYIRAPGVPAKRISQVVLNNDLAPTIADLAGVVPQRAVDGRSLVPLLVGAPWTPRRRFLVEHLEDESIYDMPSYSAIRTQRFMYAEYGGGDRELYDLAADPLQNASKHTDTAYDAVEAALAARLAGLRGCGDGSCQTLETANP